MKTLLKLAVLAAIASGFSGCTWSRVRLNDPEIVVRAKQISPGYTKVGQLPKILGAQPTRKRVEGKTAVYEYSYSDAKTEALTLLIVNFSRTENVTETLYVEADSETGVVTSVPRLIPHEPEWRCWPFNDDEDKK